MSELRECPFCGWEAVRMIESKSVDGSWWFVRCPNCSAKAGTRSFKDWAIAAWNRRAYE